MREEIRWGIVSTGDIAAASIDDRAERFQGQAVVGNESQTFWVIDSQSGDV